MVSRGQLVFETAPEQRDDLLIWFEKMDAKLDQLISIVLTQHSMPVDTTTDRTTARPYDSEQEEVDIYSVPYPVLSDLTTPTKLPEDLDELKPDVLETLLDLPETSGERSGAIPRPVFSEQINFERVVTPESEGKSSPRSDHQSQDRPRRPSLTSLNSRRSNSGTTIRSQKTQCTDHTTSTDDFLVALRTDMTLSTINSMNTRVYWLDAGWAFLTKPESSLPARLYKEAMNPLILSGVMFSLIQSIDPPPITGMPGVVAEIAIDGLLAVDIVLRFLFCPKRALFLRSRFNVIDFCQLLLLLIRCSTLFHTNLKLSDGLDLHLILLGLTPFLRLLKLLRRFDKFHLVQKAFQDALEALPVLLYTAALVWLFFSAIIFFVESRDNLDQLPRAMWLTVVTMGTVGYGDYYPREPEGQMVTTFLIMVSALYMAIPVGIIGNAFNRVWENRIYLLTIKRTRMALYQLGYTPYDIVALFDRFCSDDADGLPYKRFKRMMLSMRVGLPEEHLVELFEEFDRDGGGTVEAKEFVRAVFPEFYHEIYGRD